jgi:hypothetical protein
MSDIETLGNLLIQKRNNLVIGEIREIQPVEGGIRRMRDAAIIKATKLFDYDRMGRLVTMGIWSERYGPPVRFTLPDSIHSMLYLVGQHNDTGKAYYPKDYYDIRCMIQYHNTDLEPAVLFRLSRRVMSWGEDATPSYDTIYKIGLVLDYMEQELRNNALNIQIATAK